MRQFSSPPGPVGAVWNRTESFAETVVLHIFHKFRCGFKPHLMRQFSSPPGPVGAVWNRTESFAETVVLHIFHKFRCGFKPHLMRQFSGPQRGRCGFLTAPFCPNISNNAQDENICVRPRAIHCASFLSI